MILAGMHLGTVSEEVEPKWRIVSFKNPFFTNMFSSVFSLTSLVGLCVCCFPSCPHGKHLEIYSTRATLTPVIDSIAFCIIFSKIHLHNHFPAYSKFELAALPNLLIKLDIAAPFHK